MGADSKIEWTDHTWNPWWGCTKIDPECTHCYANDFAKRTGHQVWGADAPRRLFGAKHWNEPIKWELEAAKAGERRRVFCASMADVFEDRRDLDEHRARLWKLIALTPHLDWMLLTKRPECMTRLTPEEWREGWPVNVWAGTSGGCQKTADDNVPDLLKVPAQVHFLSAEPLLGPVVLHEEWTRPWSGLDLVIAGAESGAGHRGMQEEWVRSLRDQAVRHGLRFFYKQKLDERGHKVSLPLLDGKQWAQLPEVSV